MRLTISTYSTALFSTWVFIEEFGLLFDAGDGVSAHLMQKSRKVKKVFISHPDRDHLGGLFQFHQLNARPGMANIYYPRDSGSFPFMKDFLKKFDPHVSGTEWESVVDGSEIFIGRQHLVQCLRNEHVPVPKEVSKSLSFKLIETKQKVKQQYRNLGPKGIPELIQTKGRDEVMEEVRTNLFSYSADTPVDDYSKWDGSEILMHEATFLPQDRTEKINTKSNKHSFLDEVMKMVSEIEVGQLILSHFSSRYHDPEIEAAVRKYCKEYKIEIPVRIIYPGQVHVDVLNDEPVNA